MAVAAKMEVENPAEALRNAEGTFRVKSPYGDVFQVTCRKGRRTTSPDVVAQCRFFEDDCHT